MTDPLPELLNRLLACDFRTLPALVPGGVDLSCWRLVGTAEHEGSYVDFVLLNKFGLYRVARVPGQHEQVHRSPRGTAARRGTPRRRRAALLPAHRIAPDFVTFVLVAWPICCCDTTLIGSQWAGLCAG